MEKLDQARVHLFLALSQGGLESSRKGRQIGKSEVWAAQKAHLSIPTPGRSWGTGCWGLSRVGFGGTSFLAQTLQAPQYYGALIM